MISEKIFSAYYTIDIDGDAADVLLDNKFNIKSATIYSRQCVSDIEAIETAKKVLELLSHELKIKYEPVEQYNPEFLPGFMNSHEQFDLTGDFVSSRITVNADTSNIIAKILVHPREYLAEKIKDEIKIQYVH